MAEFGQLIQHALAFGRGIFGVVIETGQGRQAEGLEFFQVVVHVLNAVHAHPGQREHQHGQIGELAQLGTKEVEEFFAAQVGPEARFLQDQVGAAQAGQATEDGTGAVSQVGKRPAMHEHGGTLQGLHQVGLQGVAQQHRHGAGHFQVGSRHRSAGLVGGHDDRLQTSDEVIPVARQG